MNFAVKGLRHAANAIAAAMLAAMFLTFLLQIFSRYVLAEPFGWTLELCLTLWVWLVFWSCAFTVKHEDHVTFDLFYHGVSPKVRRIFALFGAVAVVIGFACSLYPTWDYIDFLRIKKSAVMRIPMRTVYSIYAVFLIAVIATYIWRAYQVARFGAPEDHAVDPTEKRDRFSKK